MLPILSGVFLGWLAATVVFAGGAFTWYLLRTLFPQQPTARFWGGLLLLVLGALPALALALVMAFGSASLIEDAAIAWTARGAFLGTAVITVISFLWMFVFRTPQSAPASHLPPPMPLGTFPSGHRFSHRVEETIHFGEPDPGFTMQDMQDLEAEVQAEEHLAMMRDSRAAAQN